MARPTKISESPVPDHGDLYGSSPPPRRPRPGQASLSPAGSTSSDKENRTAQPSVDKGKGRATMGPPRVPSPNGKRKRLAEQDAPQERVRRRRTVEVDEEDEMRYDPEQDVGERRRIRKGLRDIHKTLDDNKSEFLHPESTGLRDALLQANNLADQVKQTADATLDSKLLFTAAEMVMKRTNALISGDAAQSVDIDEFIGKCVGFMRAAHGAADDEEDAPSRTQRARRGRGDEDDDGGHLNWAHLGRFACLKHNSRPAVPGFLLGPLSAEKRAKKILVRKAPLRHADMVETRPEVLKIGDVQKDENATLSKLCTQIYDRLAKAREDAIAAVNDESAEDMTEKEVSALMDRHGTTEDGGVALFKFVINPYSFGQTVENIFYTSFLIRDGRLGITTDDRGLPYLDCTEPGGGKGGGSSKHQAIISIDMALWKQLIESFDIREPMIRHREEEDRGAGSVKGWYGS